MKMKRNLLALAISGGLVAAPMVASANGPEVYGLIDIGLEHQTDSNDLVGAREIFSGFNSPGGNSDARDFTLQNGMQTRLGVRGEEELDYMGLTASYNVELAVDILNESGGGASAGSVGTRLGWAAIGGDFGTVKVGTQWMPLYEFGGWNTQRTDTHGYGTYFYVTELLSNSLTYGFRQSSAISYSYGSAWDHSDPFAFNVTLGVGEGQEDGVQNEEGVSSVQVAGQYTFDQRFSVNAVYLREFNTYEGIGGQSRVSFGNEVGVALNDDIELFNVGARYSVTDALEFAVNYIQADANDSDVKRDAWTIGSFMDFGEGLTGHLGVGQGSDDRDENADVNGRDIDLNLYGFVKQDLSDRTNVRFEFEHIRYDGDAVNDGNATVAMVALQHSF